VGRVDIRSLRGGNAIVGGFVFLSGCVHNVHRNWYIGTFVGSTHNAVRHFTKMQWDAAHHAPRLNDKSKLSQSFLRGYTHFASFWMEERQSEERGRYFVLSSASIEVWREVSPRRFHLGTLHIFLQADTPEEQKVCLHLLWNRAPNQGWLIVSRSSNMDNMNADAISSSTFLSLSSMLRGVTLLHASLPIVKIWSSIWNTA